MEVHQHTHTERKKWHHYFWEFFMLFLAVTLGFLVENQRENFVEHQREKQYIRSLIKDIQNDTAELKKSLANTEASIQSIDSMLLLLTNQKLTDEIIIKSYYFTFPALNNIPVVFNDRTIVQLKNSGNMRIIRNQNVNDALINYWGHIETIKNTLSRHNAYRTKARDLETKIYNLAEKFLRDNRVINDSTGQIQLIGHDLAIIREYANTIAYCGIMLKPRFGLRDQIIEQLHLATELIELIKKEYHME
jgi:hypothetical protein